MPDTKKPKKIPVSAAKKIADTYNQDQIILVTWDKANNIINTVSYGKTKKDCEQATAGVNWVRDILEKSGYK